MKQNYWGANRKTPYERVLYAQVEIVGSRLFMSGSLTYSETQISVDRVWSFDQFNFDLGQIHGLFMRQ